MNLSQLIEKKTVVNSLVSMYPGKKDGALNRYYRIEEQFIKSFDHGPHYWFSTPGRTELSGNHTDHNHGKVLSASIQLDAVAAVREASDTDRITVYSEGFQQPFKVDLANLNFEKSEKETTTALIKGILRAFKDKGYSIGGFEAYVHSNVLVGSGLSSSACFEVLMATILNTLYNNETVLPMELAEISQWAENEYFGKPCGLMDQMACALGGIQYMDFRERGKAVYDKIDYSFIEQGYHLLIVDTGGSHVDLTSDYASIPYEMKKVAAFFNKENCRQIDPEDFFKSFSQLVMELGSRPVLRAYHFFMENLRVEEQRNALKKNDFNRFLRLTGESGNSSFKYLQNIYSPKELNEQRLTIAMALTERFFNANGGRGICRVHGGGFAGTIQVYLPNECLDDYVAWMRDVSPDMKTSPLFIRPLGSLCLNSL